MAAVAAAQAQEAVYNDAALKESVELVPFELGQIGPGGRCRLGEDDCGVLLQHAVQRSLLGAVSLVLDQGASGCPLGLSTDC